MGGKELKGAYKGLTCMHIRAEVSNFEKKKKKNNSSYKHRMVSTDHFNPTSNVWLDRKFLKCPRSYTLLYENQP